MVNFFNTFPNVAKRPARDAPGCGKATNSQFTRV